MKYDFNVLDLTPHEVKLLEDAYKLHIKEGHSGASHCIVMNGVKRFIDDNIYAVTPYEFDADNLVHR